MKFDFIGSESEEGRAIAANFKKCPVCGKQYEGFPAISRKDNKTELCPDCGAKEAFEIYGRGKGE